MLHLTETEIYKKHHSVIDMVTNKFKFSLCGRGLEFDDLRQEGEIIYIRAIHKMDSDKVSNIGAYLWKAVYRQLKVYIEQKDSLLCCDSIYDDYYSAKTLGEPKNIDKDRLVSIMQEVLSKLDDKKRYVMESLFGFNGKDVMSQAQIGRTLGMSYQGVACNCNTVLGQLRKDKDLMARLKEFIGEG